MVARHSLRIAIASDNDLARAEATIKRSNEPIIFEAGLDSGAMLEIDDFRRLAATARESGALLTFTSDDPLRREFARIAGIAVEAPEPTISGARRALASADAATRRMEASDVATIMGPPQVREPIPTLTEALNEYTNHGTNESYASFSFVITPPVPRRADRPDAEWTGESAAFVIHQSPKRYRASRRVGKLAAFASIAAITLILASALVLVALIAPQAEVTLVPETEALNAEISYGVAGTGADYDVAIEPERVTTTLSFSQTIPTTGVRTESDGTAAGVILFTNPLTTEMSVAAGTVVTSPDGVAFTTSEDVIVPAADPFGSLTMGSASAGIVASAAGPEANIAAGTINGQLDSGLFYTNRDATSGGTTRDIAVVAEADIETLRVHAQADFAARASSQIQDEIPDGFRALAGSGELGEPGFAFSHEAGDDATELRIDSTMRVSALAYNPDALHEMARAELNLRIIESLPDESVLLADTIEVAAPMELEHASGNPEYRMTANAQARVVLDPDLLASMKQELVGASEADALRRIAQIEGVSQYELDYGPDWFPLNWAPRLESRIAINVDDSPATQTATGETRP